LSAAGSAEPSIKLFQASQLGHLPIQRALVPPHSVQVKIDLSLAISPQVCMMSGARLRQERFATGE
jgi:hypothetical protein